MSTRTIIVVEAWLNILGVGRPGRKEPSTGGAQHNVQDVVGQKEHVSRDQLPSRHRSQRVSNGTRSQLSYGTSPAFDGGKDQGRHSYFS
jgi:hypothetical protein